MVLYHTGKSPRPPVGMGLGGFQSQSGRCGKEKDLAHIESRISIVSLSGWQSAVRRSFVI
jgi:hypothetical protein